MPVFIGIDLGSSSVKAVAFDDTGKVVAQGERRYEFDSPRDGWLEVHPERWWQLTSEVTRELVARLPNPRDVRGIGVSGIMLMPVLLDQYGEVIRPTISWLDLRVLPQLAWLEQSGLAAEMLRTTGTAIAHSQTPLPLLWVKDREPENFQRIAAILFSKDYLRFRLTGRLRTDWTDASASMLYDRTTGSWNVSLVEALGLHVEWLPEILASSDVAGELGGDVAATLGLEPGIPVIVGSGDGCSTMLGLGILRPGQLGLTVGTAGVLMSASDGFVADARGRCMSFHHPERDMWYLATATNTSGEAIRWFRNRFGYGGFAELNAEAAASPPGADGVLFLPHLAGARSPHYDPSARGAFVGLALRHGRGDLARAVMEGVAYELRECLDVHREVLALGHAQITEVYVSGGAVKSPLWLQIIADVLRVPLHVPEATELGALGAAMSAAVGTGRFSNYATASLAMLRRGGCVDPQEATWNTYEVSYGTYRETYAALRHPTSGS